MFALSRRTTASRPAGLVVAVTVALLATLALALSAGAARAASPDYVALGDSYSAGSLVLPADTSSPLCLRSQHNYPKLTAASLGLSLNDVTCGAATTEHMTTSQYPGVAPQFDALKPDTKVVTLGIGGNDETLFVGAIVTCGAIGLANPLTVLNIGAPCRDLIASDYYAKADAIEPKIADVVAGIQSRSPDAEVLVVGYPDLLPQSGRCWPTIPLTSGDVGFLEQLTRRLNTSVRTAAEEHGATYVDLYPQSIGHDACKSASVRWIEPVIPNVISGSAVPLHPNGRGMDAASTAVDAAMQAAGL